MRCHIILKTPLCILLFLLGVFVSTVNGADFSVTPLESGSDIAVYEVSGNYDAYLSDGTTNTGPREEIAKEFYKAHADEYDFLVIFSNFDFQMPTGAIAIYLGVKNDVQGIGEDLFDYSSSYGSGGVLQGTIDMGNIHSVVSDPLDPDFSDTLGTLSHELLHRWAARVTFQEDDGGISGDLLGKDGSHWSFLLDTAGSLEYGNEWVDNGNSTFTSLEGRKYYSPLDLYLMGFVDKSEVEPMLLIENSEIDPTRVSEPGVTIEGTAQYISIDDIIAAEGEREPNVEEAQKSFRVGCIYITSPGTYSEADLAGIRDLMENWPVWFSGLTNGIAKISTDNDPLRELPENPGPETPAIDPRTAPAEVNDGLTWLLDNQREDGSWRDDSLTVDRDTATVLYTLVGYTSGEEAFNRGVSWLENADSSNLDYLARKIKLLANSGQAVSESAAKLSAMQNPDGGWGSGEKYESNSADTALVLQALSAAGEVSDAVVEPAISYLLAKQNADSGWGIEEQSTIQTSIDVITAFIPFCSQYQLDNTIQNTLGWLYTKQNTDGGFGNSPSTIYNTATLIITLKKLGISTGIVDNALSYILAGQGADGSWQASSYQTALAVNAIWSVMRDPDLSVSTEEIIPTPETITSLPTDLSLAVTIQNLGLTDVTEARVVLYDGTVSEAGMIGEAVVAVAGSSAETVVFNTTVNDGGLHHYYVTVDPDNVIAESSEQNNSALRIVNLESTYDFVINAEGISISPATGDIYEPLSISATVRNNGTVDASNVTLDFTLDNGNDLITIATGNIDLPAGESGEYTISWEPEISGAGFSLTVTVDPHESFAEVDEDNNSATVSLDINGSVKPDLSLSHADITCNPSPALEAGEVSLTAKVFNRGFSSATDVQVDYYDGVFGEDGTVFLGSVTIAEIAAGGSGDVAIDWTGITVAGDRTISIVVDAQNLIEEISEDNNSAFVTLQVLSLPDFAVSDTSISFSPEAPREGDEVTVSAIVQNQGEQSGTDVPVAFYEGGVLVGTAVISEIAGNGQETTSIVFTDTDGRVGVVEFEVIVDPEDAIVEQDETNNRAARNVGVQNVDLWLSQDYISPNGDGVKDDTDFGYRLTTAQDVTVVLLNEEDEVVREYSGSDFSDTSYVSLNWDGLDNEGVVVDDGQYQIQVLANTGSVLASLLVTVDTNRSSLLQSAGTPYLYTMKIQGLFGGNNYLWFPDDSGLLVNLEVQDPEYPEYEAGIYTVSPLGDVTRLVPEGAWDDDGTSEVTYRYKNNASNCDYVGCRPNDTVSFLSADGYTIAFILEKHSETSWVDQVWIVDRFGENLTLLDSCDGLKGDTCDITDVFPSPDGTHVAYKLYDSTTEQYDFAIIRSDGSNKKIFTTGWGWNQGREHLSWSPDGTKVAFSDGTYVNVADVDGNVSQVLPVKSGWASKLFFDWHGADKILVRDLYSIDIYNSVMDSWLVDLNAPDSPLLIAEKLDFDWGWRMPHIPENGYFIAGLELLDFPYVKYKICDIEGNCQDHEMILFCEFCGVPGFPPSVTPDGEEVVVVDGHGFVMVQDRETLETDIYQRTWSYDYNYLQDEYDLPSTYTVWLPAENDYSASVYIGYYYQLQWMWFDEINFLATSVVYDDRDDWDHYSQFLVAFNIEKGEEVYFPEVEYFSLSDDLLLSPEKGYISFWGYTGDTSYYNLITIIGSFINLTADLQVNKTESAINFQGIATDLNFSNWTLEYADQDTPDEWHLITPTSEEPIVDDVLATWIPPYEGSFLVRLTVEDKAGNTAWDRSVVTWGKELSVNNIYQIGRVFSPNGDGVKDTVGLNYTVQEPVHLEFHVYDEAGALIKTFNEDHALPGEYGIVWDGRDELGGIAPDGDYVVQLLDYEYFFGIDTVLPDVRLEFSEVDTVETVMPVDCLEFSECEVRIIGTSLSGLALDDNLKSWSISYGEGENPDEWHEIQSGDSALEKSNKKGEREVDEDGNPVTYLIQNFTTETFPAMDFPVNKTYRIFVEDSAGNQRTAEARFTEEIFVLAEWDEIKIDLEKIEQGVFESPDTIGLASACIHTLTIFETLRNSVSSATVQYRESMQWYDAEVTTVPADGKIELAFDASLLDPEWNAGVRVKFVDHEGVEYYSNTVVLHQVFKAEMSCLTVYNSAYMHLAVSLAESLVTLEIQATNENSEWESFVEYEVYDDFSYLFGAPTSEDFPEGYKYPLRFIGIGESGDVYTSNSLTYPSEPCENDEEEDDDDDDDGGGDDDDEEDDDGGGGVRGGGQVCSKTNLKVLYDPEIAACNSLSCETTATIYLNYCPNDEPSTMPERVNYYLEENGVSRLLKQVQFDSDGWGSVTLEMDDFSEGSYPVSVDLVYGESVIEAFRQSTLLVDHTLPTAEITYPSASQPVCVTTVTDDDGNSALCLGIQCFASGGNSAVSDLIAYGYGENPTEWFDTYDARSLCNQLTSNNDVLVGWEVRGLEALDHSLRLKVTDSQGNTSCSVVRVVEDDILHDLSLTAGTDESLISPNADGVKDTVSIWYKVTEEAVLDLTILHDDTVIRTLASEKELTDNSEEISWDGRDENGVVVADGSYEIRVQVRNICGDIWEKLLTVTVDNTSPTTIISFPEAGDTLDVVTEVTGSVSDTHLSGYQLYAKDEASDDEPILLNEANSFVENDLLGTWNTYGLEGNWSLILIAEDSVGNTGTATSLVSFGSRDVLISDLSAVPLILSPDGDGKYDSTTATFTLLDTADIIITIEDGFGNVIASESRPNTPSGSHQYQWAGLEASGNSAADGNYQLKVKAESVIAPLILQEERITLTIDTIPPTIELLSPLDASYHANTVTVQGSITDLNLEQYSVTLSGGTNDVVLATQIVDEKIEFFEKVDLVEGVYAIEVVAGDSVENRSSMTVSLTVDKTKPLIELESPLDDEYFGWAESVVTIKGVIEEINPQSYTVQYGVGDEPNEWIDLASGEAPPADNVLATWVVGADQSFVDGDYTVRVTAVDKAGWESTAQVGIHLDNNAPELVITNPETEAFVTEQFDIIGTVTDSFLKEFTLELADSDCSTAANWSVLRTGTQAIQNSSLAVMETLPADGVYCLRLSAADFPGNASEQQLDFTIDTTPPGPPMLSGNLDGAAVTLTWQGNIEPDLTGFDVYRNDEKQNTALLVEAEFSDQNLDEEDYIYTVRAVDAVGWESADSNQLEFSVDFTPPDAKIYSPRDDFFVSNYVDITGRAYSEDDFKEYRVSYGIGEYPDTWELLRTSPIPISYDSLVRWDVITLTDGQYTIKLEAEDQNGNVGEDLVTVTVDNTPPSAPVLFSATPDGSTVDLAWQANNESDLAGYLVFRNGELANASGTVVGDFSPYLVTELAFADTEVPDGTHDYYLLAMDEAGNMSDQSNSLRISLDTHAPHLTMSSPSAGLEFDKAITVKAVSEDTDIDTVQFQYRLADDSAWTGLGDVLTLQPYVVNFDPAGLGLQYGSYLLRAVATDEGGLSDEAPEEVTVYFKDITAPAAPTGVTAQVNGGFISLSWTPGEEDDLAGYNVYQGSNDEQRNDALISDTSFVDPADGASALADGDYEYTVTAVDTAGNESEKSTVTVTVFSPVLNEPSGVVNVPEYIVEGSTLPGATVEIFRDSESLGTTSVDTDGQLALTVSLHENDNNLQAIATDTAGNISKPSNTISVVYDMLPAAPTGLVAEVDNYEVHLSWNVNTEVDLAGYNLYRTTDTDWQQVNSSVLAANTYTDTGLTNNTYTYRVTAVDNAGSESEPSTEASALIERQLPAPPTNLVATALPQGQAIDLCWERSVDQVTGYLVYRGPAAGGPYTGVNDTSITDSCYQDSGLTNGTEYFYVVRAVDSFGNESVTSNEASAVAQDTVTPSAPIILQPTVSGTEFQSSSELIDIAGVSEVGAFVDLIHDQEWIDTVETSSEQVYESFVINNQYDSYGSYSESVVFPDGKSVIYRQGTSWWSSYFVQQDLATGSETLLDQLPSSWDHVFSPDGSKIAYNQMADLPWLNNIGIYDMATGVATRLTTDEYVSEGCQAWSNDGTKILFCSNRDGWGIWLHDLLSGETSLVATDASSYSALSADDQTVAFLGWSDSLYLVDVNGGTPVVLDDNPYISWENVSFAWSPQAKKIVFTANRDGFYDIYVYDADTEETIRLTNTEDTEMDPRWSPDGNYISYYIESNGEIEVRMVSADELAQDQSLNAFEGSIAGELQWLSGGIFYQVESDLHKITPPGTFLFEDVGLVPGQNIFTAEAWDAAGNVSERADEIVVNIDADAMPDLEVLDQDIFLSPSAPLVGDEVTFGVLFGNISSVTAENISVDVYVWDAEDNIELIHSETLSSLEPYVETWLSATWDSADMAGKNKVYVLIDADDEIAESQEDNNKAFTEFYVAEEEGIVFDFTINGDEFWSNEVVSLTAEMYNSGSEQNVQLAVTIEDENGELVEELADREEALAYGAAETVELSWHAGSVFAGTYQVRAVLVDAAGNVIEEHIDPFTVLPDIEVYAELTTDKLEYGPNEDVRLDIFVTNEGANVLLPELQVKVTITNESSVLHTAEQTLRNLYPRDVGSFTIQWDTALNTPADYTAEVDVYLDGELVEVCSTEFTINPVSEITGDIAVTPAVIFPDGTVEVAFTVTNQGNIEAGTIPLQFQVVNSDNWNVITEHEESITPGMNATVSDRHAFSDISWNIGVYQVQLKAFHQDETLSLASDSFTVKDGVAPTITVESPVDGSVISESFDLSVIVIDDFTGVVEVEYQIDSGDWLPLPAIDSATGRYSAELDPNVVGEGAHTFNFRATDNAGNTSELVGVDVTIELCKVFEELIGSLHISPNLLYYSQNVTLQYSLTNQCAKSLDGLDVRVTVVYPDSDDAVFEAIETVSLASEASATGGFTLSSLDLQVWSYSVLLEIDLADQEPRIVEEASFEVLAAVETENKVFDQTNLLVWLNNGQENFDEGCASYASIENALSQAADYSLVVCGRADFEAELRSSFYTDIMIIGDQHQLTDHHDSELREKVNSGTGLISFGWHVPGDNTQDDDSNGNDKESFLGVTEKGTLSNSDYTLTLEDSAASSAGELAITGTLARVEAAEDTEVAGWVMDKCRGNDKEERAAAKSSEECAYPVIVTHEYGLGRTVYAAFDLCEAFTDTNVDQLTDLFVNAVEFVHNHIEEPELIPYQVKPFALELTSPGLDFDLQLSTTCPPEIILFDPATDDWVAEYPWEVTFPVQAGETTVLPYYVLAPDQEGTFSCETSTGFDISGQYASLDKIVYEFVVNKDRSQYLEEVLVALGELDLSGNEDAKRDNALQYLQDVADRTTTDCEQAEQIIHDIEKAIDSLLDIESLDTGDLRLQLDTLLRIEQGRCYFYE